MAESPSREVLARVRKLALLPEEVKQSRWAVSVTRMTSLKTLCQQPDVANRFVTSLARKALQRVEEGKGRSSQPGVDLQRVHKGLMTDALAEMEAWLQQQSDDRRRRLRDLLGRMQAQQNEHQQIRWGSVRLVRDWDLLVVEDALRCLLGQASEAGHWAYQTARDHAERYNPSEGTGLVSSSAPFVQDVADFWIEEFGLDRAALAAPASQKKAKNEKPAARSRGGTATGATKPRFTQRQGQFLAFIHLYRKLHRQGPAEHELVTYFRVTPPAVHGMLVKLDELGLITRQAGVPRSARVSIPETEIPLLEGVEGPPW
jgi:hypothetical protein